MTNQYTIDNLADPNHPTQVYTVSLAGPPYYATLASVTSGNLRRSTAMRWLPVGLPVGGRTFVVLGRSLTHTVTIDSTTGTAVIQ